MEILRCKKCKAYTLEKYCECGGLCTTPKPAPYKPKRLYAKYRTIYKQRLKT